jgi:hypothetical protein
MKFVGCSGVISLDSSGNVKCSTGFETFTTEQLTNEIAVNGNAGITPELYEALSVGMAVIMIVAFGWRLSYKTVEDMGKNNDE